MKPNDLLDNNIKFVQIIRNFPHIWKETSLGIICQNLVELSWREVAKQMSDSIAYCRCRWKVIKKGYIQGQKYPRTDSAGVLRNSYYLAKYLDFLENKPLSASEGSLQNGKNVSNRKTLTGNTIMNQDMNEQCEIVEDDQEDDDDTVSSIAPAVAEEISSDDGSNDDHSNTNTEWSSDDTQPSKVSTENGDSSEWSSDDTLPLNMLIQKRKSSEWSSEDSQPLLKPSQARKTKQNSTIQTLNKPIEKRKQSQWSAEDTEPLKRLIPKTKSTDEYGNQANKTMHIEWIKKKRAKIIPDIDGSQSFLNSLLPYLRNMTVRQNRRFQQKVITLVDQILDDSDIPKVITRSLSVDSSSQLPEISPNDNNYQQQEQNHQHHHHHPHHHNINGDSNFIDLTEDIQEDTTSDRVDNFYSLS